MSEEWGSQDETERTPDDATGAGSSGSGTGAGAATPSPPAIAGTVRIGRRYLPREQHEALENPLLHELLKRDDLAADAIISAEQNAEVTILDLDTHDWTTPPRSCELDAHAAAIAPPPDAWWMSHGRGLKLVYTGPNHHDRALAAAFSVPPAFGVAIIRHTRHPRSTSSDPPGSCAGRPSIPRRTRRRSSASRRWGA